MKNISTKEVAANVRDELKKALPGWKFSVTYQSFAGGSAIDLALMAGPEDVQVSGEGYHQLNQYCFMGDRGLITRPWNNGAQLTEKGWDVMEQATKILAAYHWDQSDAQIDYFCCNFYMRISIGKWNKPYTTKGK